MMDQDFDIREEQLSSSEKEFENALRPLAFNDFSGQQQVVENLEVFVVSLSTTSCCTALPDWVRQPCRTSLPMSWV